MPAHHITPSESTTTAIEHRPSGLAVRVLIALIISWLIVMAFFVTTVASH